MWARNLLFLALIGVVALGLRASLFSWNRQNREIAFHPGITAEDQFRTVVKEVDSAFQGDWKQQRIQHAERASDLAVARRLSLVLTGSVPSLEEIRQFEAQPTETRLEGWANHLLNDRRYGDYFAERFARSYLGTEDGPLIVYRKRRFLAWLSEELLKNTSYAQIVQQLIADRGLNTDHPAVNFIAATFDDEKNAPDPERLVIRLSRAFLGLRIDCAQCHDYYHDPSLPEPTWLQTDFQGLAAYFGQTRQIVTHVTDGDGEYRYEDRTSGELHEIAPAVPFLPELVPSTGTRREQLAAWVTDSRNVNFARATVNRVWAMMFGRPLRERIEAPTLTEPLHPALEILANDFTAHGHDLKRLILLISSTEAFRLESRADFEITDAHEHAWAVFPLTPLRPEQVIGNVIQASSVKTSDQRSHVMVRLVRYFNERDFVQRYGDSDDDDFARAHGTIPQRLLMMNGELVDARAKEEFLNASAQIAMFAPDDAAAVDTAYLAVLTRRPTPAERDYFVAKLTGTSGEERRRQLADLYWVLFNSTELSWLS